MIDYNEIGQNIKKYRLRKQMKQAELAEPADVSAQHISHIECGITKLSLPLLIQLSKVLSVDLYTLLGSNIGAQPVLEEEFAHILNGTSLAQRTLCLELCRTVIEYGNGLQHM